jgi:uncharacterized membrane protein
VTWADFASNRSGVSYEQAVTPMESHHSNQEIQQQASDARKSEYAVAGAACYAIGILAPLLFLSSKSTRSSAFLRFHSFQSLILFCVWIPLRLLGLLHPGKGEPIVTIFSLLCLVACVTAIVQALRGKTFRIPGIGVLAEWLSGLYGGPA